MGGQSKDTQKDHTTTTRNGAIVQMVYYHFRLCMRRHGTNCNLIDYYYCCVDSSTSKPFLNFMNSWAQKKRERALQVCCKAEMARLLVASNPSRLTLTYQDEKDEVAMMSEMADFDPALVGQYIAAIGSCPLSIIDGFAKGVERFGEVLISSMDDDSWTRDGWTRA